MKIIAIIVTHNGEKWIEKCLGSLVESTVPVDIITIDNDSKDQTVAIIKKDFPQVNLIESGKNIGFGRANNIGLNVALSSNADYVFLLNQDAYVAADCIDILMATSAAYKEYGILSPFHLNYTGNTIEEYFKKWIIAVDAHDYISDLYNGNVQELYGVLFVHAAGWLLPINTVKRIGGFDPLFFHYGEDNDYVQRVLFRNYKVGFVPKAIMFHQGTNAGLITTKKHISLKRNFATIHLKNPKARFLGAAVVVAKGILDGITSAILYRNLKRLKEDCILATMIIRTIGKIRKSRQTQLKDLAYLNN